MTVQDHYPILEGHLAAGRLDQAESVALHLLDLDPADSTARCAMGRLLAARGRREEALTFFEDLTDGTPRDPVPVAWLAVCLAAEGAAERAAALARRSYQLGGRIPAALVLLGDQALAEGDLDEALNLYEEALERSAEEAGAWHGKGRVMREFGELVMAEDAFVRAVQLAADRVEVWIDLVDLEQGAGAHEVAAENLTLALRAHPGHPGLLALKEREQAGPVDELAEGLVRIRTALYEGDAEAAVELLDELVLTAPDDPRLAVAKGEVCLALEQHHEIPPLVHELNRLTRREPMAWEPKCVLGRLLLRDSPLQNTRMATAMCEEAWRISGEHAHAGIGLIEAWAATGKRAYAKALVGRLAGEEGPEATRARAILEGRV